MSEVTQLPVLPLREAVLFPDVTSPIAAGRPGTLRAIEAALKDDEKRIFVVSQRENLEDPDAAIEEIRSQLELIDADLPPAALTVSARILAALWPLLRPGGWAVPVFVALLAVLMAAGVYGGVRDGESGIPVVIASGVVLVGCVATLIWNHAARNGR